MVCPGQTQLAPADLEIEFQVCERADVLNRAAILPLNLEPTWPLLPVFLTDASKGGRRADYVWIDRAPASGTGACRAAAGLFSASRVSENRAPESRGSTGTCW